MHKVIKGIFVSFAIISLSVWADVKETETFSFELADGGRISLENVNGDIRITGGAGNAVDIKADKRADNDEDLAKVKVEVKAEPDAIYIRTVHEKSASRWFGNNNSGEVSYTLTVPFGANLDTITTVNGEVEVSAVSGTVNAKSVNGEIRLENLMGDADLETINGSIEAYFDRLEGSQKMDVDTVNGRITLHLPANTSARLSAETLNGSIDAKDFGLEVDSGGFVGKDLSGTIGSGDARINLDTVNGGIRVRKQELP